MSNTSTYPLRLPRSVKTAVEKLAKEEGVSLNQFVATAVAEKLAAMNTANFFTGRKNQVGFEAFRSILTRDGGQPRKKVMNYPFLSTQMSFVETHHKYRFSDNLALCYIECPML